MLNFLSGYANYDPLELALMKMPEKERREYYHKLRNRKAVVRLVKINALQAENTQTVAAK